MKKQLELVTWSRYFLIIVGGIIGVRLFLFAPYVVKGVSMEPTLINNERILVNKGVYYAENPQRGDVIVLHATKEDDYIKRIIGIPGDELELKNGVLYRNGSVANEPYIAEVTLSGFERLVVPKDSYFVMGDNRNRSMDSREIGFIERSHVVGRAEYVFYPLASAHEVR
ncbi:signal peptidase I [Aneurinibacillus soli]|uniref:Signal peptidase I n=1 Tax=Aneurinibacillus soli TaxID=1500254 RepID=A0A0U5BEP4_9BACL|nr:signal peptidase I [Aneurinibacillus soli]PYE59505.1 signal peptidase I [Aneurinibacillus soli]BAU29165.1 Signal peptidase I P [Aneurinibacillus soli]